MNLPQSTGNPILAMSDFLKRDDFFDTEGRNLRRPAIQVSKLLTEDTEDDLRLDPKMRKAR